MKKIKSLKMDASRRQLSPEELRMMKGGNNSMSGSLGLPDWAGGDNPNKPGGGDGDPPPEIGTQRAFFCAQDI